MVSCMEADGSRARNGQARGYQNNEGRLIMRINCLSCGHKVDLGDAYDDYAGRVKCMVCGVILEIKTEEGNVKSVAVAMKSEIALAGAGENVV